MVFNDVTTKLGICQEVDGLCDSDTTSYPVADKTRRANSAMETLIGKILVADGTWQYDDTNHTDLPVGTGTLVSGQSSYTFAEDYLEIENIKIKDVNGNWYIITPIDQADMDIPLENYLETDGLPLYYDKVGDTIKLYPAPDNGISVTLASGIKIQFKRTASLFTASDTTKAPGIPSPWHVTIAKIVALPYCKTYKKDRVTQLERDIQEETKDLLKHFGRREQDKRKQPTMKPIQFH